MTGTEAFALRFGLKALKSIASKWWAKRVAKKEAKRKAKAEEVQAND